MAAKQTKTNVLKMIVPAGKATPSPPVGPILGQRDIKAIDFCKQFNDRTKSFVPGVPIPVKLSVNPDRSYSFTTKSPATAWLLLKAAGVEKGAKKPGSEIAGTVTLKHVYEIAKVKQTDELTKDVPLQKLCKHIVGQASSMGIQVVP